MEDLMKHITKALFYAVQYELEIEVLATAMKAIHEDGLSPKDAVDYACNEWLK